MSDRHPPLIVNLRGLEHQKATLGALAGVNDNWILRIAKSKQPVVKTRNMLYDLLTWAWLSYVQSSAASEVQDRFSQRVAWTIEAMGDHREYDSIGVRSAVDLLLLYAALISDNEESLQSVLSSVPGLTKPQHSATYFDACTEVLRRAIMDDPLAAAEALAELEKRKPDRSRPFPSQASLRAVIYKDGPGMDHVKRVAEMRYLGYAKKCGAIVTSPDGSSVLDPRKLDLHFTWPYLEAGCCKILSRSGTGFSSDSIWLPAVSINWGAL